MTVKIPNCFTASLHHTHLDFLSQQPFFCVCVCLKSLKLTVKMSERLLRFVPYFSFGCARVTVGIMSPSQLL